MFWILRMILMCRLLVCLNPNLMMSFLLSTLQLEAAAFLVSQFYNNNNPAPVSTYLNLTCVSKCGGWGFLMREVNWGPEKPHQFPLITRYCTWGVRVHSFLYQIILEIWSFVKQSHGLYNVHFPLNIFVFLGRMTVGNRHGLLVPMSCTDQVQSWNIFMELIH